MMSTAPRRAGRPKRSVLDRDLIVRTAFDVLRRTGPEDFTMAALAGELGVKTPALYHHVGNKTEVLSSMRELITSGIDHSGFGTLPWLDATRRWPAPTAPPSPPTRTRSPSWPRRPSPAPTPR